MTNDRCTATAKTTVEVAPGVFDEWTIHCDLNEGHEDIHQMTITKTLDPAIFT